MLLTWTLFLVFPRQGSTVPESFSSRDAEVLSQLPLFMRESFTFVLTRKSANNTDVLEEITDDLVHAQGFAASRAALEQVHLKEVHARELKYYNMLLWRKQNVPLQPITAVTGFGSFGDPDGYNAFVPSEYYLSSVWCDVMQNRPVAKLGKLVQGVEGEVRVLVEVATVATESAERFWSSDPCPKGRDYATAHSTKYFVTPSGTFDYSVSAVSHGGPVPACYSRSTPSTQIFWLNPVISRNAGLGSCFAICANRASTEKC